MEGHVQQDGGGRLNLRKALIIGLVAAIQVGAIGLMISLRLTPRTAAVAAPATIQQPPPEPHEPRIRPVSWQPAEPAVPLAERRRVPVLMYHEVTRGPNNLYVAPEELAGHLTWLQQHGYTAITLQQLHGHLTDGEPIPDKPVVLTFDDGYVSYYQNALPLLKQHQWPATLFVITGFVGERGYMTWDQVREAASAGTELGAHTINHPSLDLLKGDRLVREVAGSRRVLQQETGRSIDFFCYPAGKLSDEVLRVVREAGFVGAVTTKWGLTDASQDPYRWDRIRINKGLSPEGLGSLIETATHRK